MKRTLLILAALLLAPAAWAGTPCTAGTDCYCDRVEDSGDAIYDANLILCEDWEAPTLYYVGTCTNDASRNCVVDGDCVNPGTCDDTAWIGDGAPYYGPWWDATGSFGPYDRGNNSYFTNVYNDASAGSICRWATGEPGGTPVHGQNCDSGGTKCRNNSWTSPDRYGNDRACNAILQDGDFDNELALQPEPSGASDGGSGAFDGLQSVGWRNGPEVESGPSGIQGEYNFTAVTEYGITKAWTYSTNADDGGLPTGPGLFCAAWKHNEFIGPASGGPAAVSHDAPTGLPKGLDDDTPYWVRFQYDESGSFSACESAMASATMNVGTYSCGDSRLNLFPDNALYTWSNNFDMSEWHCVRAHAQGYGRAFGSGGFDFKLWHDGVLIIDLANFDGTMLRNSVNNMKWNNFANTNQGLSECNGGEVTTKTIYRYEDNFHFTEGEPVSCAQIGFGSPTPPPEPTLRGVMVPAGLTY